MRERWLLTGASGQLGYSLLDRWNSLALPLDIIATSPSKHSVFDVPWIPADLTDDNTVASILHAVRPTHILHCAGEARTRHERGPGSTSFRLAVRATEIFADYCRQTGAWCLFCSSDFVFNGQKNGSYSETDTVQPINTYGRFKVLGEEAMRHYQAGLVARLSLLYCPQNRSGRSTWFNLEKQLARNELVRAVSDEIRTPLKFERASAYLTDLALQRKRGTVHVGGQKTLKPYQLIETLRVDLGSSSPIVPIKRSQWESSEARPANVALDTRRLHDWLSASQIEPSAFGDAMSDCSTKARC